MNSVPILLCFPDNCLHGADAVAAHPHVLRVRRATSGLPGVGGIVHIDFMLILTAAEMTPVAVGV